VKLPAPRHRVLWLVCLLALSGCGLLFPLDDVKKTPEATAGSGASSSSGSGGTGNAASGSGGNAGPESDGGDPGHGGSPSCTGVFDSSTFDQGCFQ
jgi:hypothetical protein